MDDGAFRTRDSATAHGKEERALHHDKHYYNNLHI